MSVAQQFVRAARGRFEAWRGNVPFTASLMGVWYAVALHTIWAVVLFTSTAPKHVTGLYGLSRLFPAQTGLALVLITVAGCASYGLLKKQATIGARVALLVPQQLILGVSASSAVRAMWVGHFADGVPRPATFLIADQSPAILALLAHSATILYLALIRRWD